MSFKLSSQSIYLFRHPLLWNHNLCNTLNKFSRISVFPINCEIVQYSNFTPTQKIDQKLNNSKEKIEDLGEIIGKWYKKYQDFVGISEILEAQDRVTKLTDLLLGAQSKRRQLQRDVETVHQQLLATHQRINKSELYSEEHYSLFEKARELSLNLKTKQSQFSQTEEEERTLFTQLSTAIKHCHEKERTQSEQSKYWSILISVISASLAALITSINNWVRIKEIKDHASTLHKDNISKADQLHSLISKFSLETSSKDEAKSDDYLHSNKLIETIQSVVRAEVDHITELLKERSPSNIKNEIAYEEISSSTLPSYNISYLKVASAMITGGLLGTLITAIFWAAGGGES